MISLRNKLIFLSAFCGATFLFADFLHATTVTTLGRQLFVDGSVFAVKGVCYSPIVAGRSNMNYSWWSDPATYGTDFPLLKAMGANTIRVYDASSATQAALDAARENGLYIIMGYWVDPATNFSDAASRNALKAGFVKMVNQWKGHPAVLMWSFGNEVLSFNDPDPRRSSWYTLLNEAALAAHSEEGASFHPVTTANREIIDIGRAGVSADDVSCSSLDVWGANVYRGNTFGATFFKSLQSQTAKPFFLSEWGCDAYNGIDRQEDGPLQDETVSKLWGEIAGNLSSVNIGGVCLGGTIFEWSDEWWKGAASPGGPIGAGGAGGPSVHDTGADWYNSDYTDYEMNEEWWGIVGISAGSYARQLRPAYFSLRDHWRAAAAVSPVSALLDNVKNYPNPLVIGEAPTRIKCDVTGDPQLDISVFDLAGNKVLDLQNIMALGANVRQVYWNGKDSGGDYVPTGLYICRVKASSAGREEVLYRKIAVVK